MNDICQSLFTLLAPSTKVDEVEEYKNSGNLQQPLVSITGLWPFSLCKKDYKVEEYKNSGYSEAFNGLFWPFWLFVSKLKRFKNMTI
jgi:hypothetical protein